MNRLFLAAVAVVSLVSGCASTGVVKLSNRSFPAKPANCSMEVLNTPPQKKFVEIARVNARSGQSIFEGKTLDAMLPGMKAEACKLGADAIILSNVQEGGYNIIGPADRGNASGVAVKYEQM